MKAQRIARLALSTVVAGALAFAGGTSAAHAATGQINVTGPAGSGAFGTKVVVLPNGNVVVTDPGFDLDETHTDVGAVYLYNGVTRQLISTLTGSTTDDKIGQNVVVLTNGNFVTYTRYWDLNGSTADVGAVTWGSKTAGVSGVVSAANSIVGSLANDSVSYPGVTPLTNGNYVVASSYWDLDGSTANVGAVTWGNGTTGTSGTVSSSNSLVGSRADDNVGFVGSNGVKALTNGNYAVASSNWDLDDSTANVGAVTWGNGTTGTTGTVSSSNSLVGSKAGDKVGNRNVVALTNGNYVFGSSQWGDGTNIKVGAVTWGNGTTGTTGTVSSSNSLVGSQANDSVGDRDVIALTNGNYVVASSYWDLGGTANVGAVTWGNGTTGTIGVVSSSNSLVGSRANDSVGGYGVFALTNGNYVVSSALWTDGITPQIGAVTWGNGTTGITGAVSSSNSLIGSHSYDLVGFTSITPLANGNYVVASQYWSGGTNYQVGSVTWGNGTTGTIGVVSPSNSLVGSTNNDNVGSDYVVALTNGNYVVMSGNWNADGTHTKVGAVTWGNGATGITGAVSPSNSLVGSTSNDRLGNSGVAALSNGNYVVSGKLWDLDGTTADVGAVTWGNGATGITGVISAANSLIGTSPGDSLGFSKVTVLTNGNYIVVSPLWNLDDTHSDVGAVTLGNGSTGGPRLIGSISASSSVVGTAVSRGGSLVADFDYVNHQLVVGRPGDNIVTWLAVTKTDPQLPPTGANNNGFVATALLLIALGATLVIARRRHPAAE